jgi:hypothetical protein
MTNRRRLFGCALVGGLVALLTWALVVPGSGKQTQSRSGGGDKVATEGEAGILEYMIGCPGSILMERRGLGRWRIASEEVIAGEIRRVTREHATVRVYVSVSNLEPTKFHDVGDSMEGLKRLVAENADARCGVDAILLAIVPLKRSTTEKMAPKKP